MYELKLLNISYWSFYDTYEVFNNYFFLTFDFANEVEFPFK